MTDDEYAWDVDDVRWVLGYGLDEKQKRGANFGVLHYGNGLASYKRQSSNKIINMQRLE